MIYLKDLLELTGGELRHAGTDTHFQAFSHDTRQIEPGEMFVAVRGARGDGHDYVLDAIRKGATGLLIETKALSQFPEKIHAALVDSEAAVVVVDNTRQALQAYARGILERWHPLVIAVTGSVGKTSTKEAIATVLASRYPTFRSWQNYNDLLGIPLSLGRLEPHHRYAVLELGCDHPGEIAELCQIIRPHIGVLTNISPVLLQYFDSMERLTSEFGMLLRNLAEGGHCFYNQADDTIRLLLSRHAQEQHTELNLHPYSVPGSDQPEDSRQVRITRMDWDGLEGTLIEQGTDTGTLRRTKVLQLSSHLLGEHHFATMLAAYRVATHCGLSTDEAALALAQVRPIPGRLNPLPGIRNTRILDDTHNASPASVVAGLVTLHALTPQSGCRIAVLGDMLNLGDYAEEAHRTVGLQAARFVDYLVVRGDQADMIAEAALQAGLAPTRVIRTSSHEDAAQAVRRILDQLGSESGKQPESGKNVILIKGSEATRMERVTEALMQHPWEAPEKLVRQTPGWKKTIFRHADRPTWVEIDLNAIANNTRHVRALVGPNVRILVSLKADAYGHGALKVARTALLNGAHMLGVATVTESIPLREGGISAPILVFGYIPRWQMREAVRLSVTVTIYSSEMAQELAQAAREQEKTIKVHIKVDTGMARLGIRSERIDEILALAREVHELPELELEGIFTHFAAADTADDTYTRKQLRRFKHVLQMLTDHGLRPPIAHAANSAAMIKFPESHFDMVRPGIVIYGLDPSNEVRLPEGFRPALSFKTQVSQVKTIPAGEGISYGVTYVTERPMRIAVLPVGYADGFRRAPRTWGSVLIHGQEAPIRGHVCMDQCMVDVTHIPQTRMGDEVVLIGRQGEAALTAEMVAERLGTINYEVVSEILARVPRVD
jgi:alanine racemase